MYNLIPHKESRICWLDLEMTGLDASVDIILEIAFLVTDFNNKILHDGMSAVIHYTPEGIPSMNAWVKEHHTQSGLLQAVKHSTTSLAKVEDMVYEVLKPFCNSEKMYLAGNSIYQDKIFLKKYMPKVDALFNYRLIDVSTIKVLIQNWYPESPQKNFVKSKKHRALDDIHESIAELTHYKKYFFIK